MYDVIVLGGGPGGYHAAETAAKAGLKTVVIEKEHFGGVCLNEGCIPSKSLLYTAKAFDYAVHGEEYGVKIDGKVTFDHSVAVARKDRIVKKLVGGVKAGVKAAGAEMVEGEGIIKGKNADGTVTVSVGTTEYTAKNLIIATGSEPVMPPIPGVKENFEKGIVLTNREILSLDKVPEKLVIVGGGVIGLEMASYFNSVGSEVTVIEMLDKIAGPTEKEISAILLNNYQKKGITFCLGSKVVKVGENAVTYEKDGKTVDVPADKVLMSIGRRAVTRGYGLESLNVAIERGAIVTDSHLKTNVSGIYAIGDVNGKIMLAHTAYREADVAVNTILGKKDIMSYDAIPSVIYTNPEVGSVGETEESAAKKGIAVQIISLPMAYSGRYLAENEKGDGICKVVIDKKYNTVIGVHMICSYASEIIYGAAMMVENRMTVDNLKKQVFPHPTVSEIIKECINKVK